MRRVLQTPWLDQSAFAQPIVTSQNPHSQRIYEGRDVHTVYANSMTRQAIVV